MPDRPETVSASSTPEPRYRVPKRSTQRKSYGRIFRDFIARCGHYIRPIRKYILPNFLAVHYFYIISISILASILMYPCRNAKYIDILFLATGASTQGGLNTINLNQLNTYQQAILYLTSFVTTPIAIHGSLAFVRLYWFERYFDDIKEFSKNDFKMRRTKTILQREMTKQSMQTWRTGTFTNNGRLGSNNTYTNSSQVPTRVPRRSRWLMYHTASNSSYASSNDSNAFPRTDTRLRFIERNGPHRAGVRKRYSRGNRVPTASSHRLYSGSRVTENGTNPSESFQERLFSGTLFRRDSDLEDTTASVSNDTASTVRSSSRGTAASEYVRALASDRGSRSSNARSMSTHPTEQGTLWSSRTQSRSQSRSRGRSMSPHSGVHKRANLLYKTGTPSTERFAKMRDPSAIQPQDVYRSLHMMMNQLNNESNEGEEGPPLVVHSPHEMLVTGKTSKVGTPVRYELTRSEEELADKTPKNAAAAAAPPVSSPPSSLSSPSPISASISASASASVSPSSDVDVGEPGIIRRDSEDITHLESAPSVGSLNVGPSGNGTPSGEISETGVPNNTEENNGENSGSAVIEVSSTVSIGHQNSVGTLQHVDGFAEDGTGRLQENHVNRPRRLSQQSTVLSYYSSQSGSESESESESGSGSGSGNGTSTTSSLSTAENRTTQDTDEFYDVQRSPTGDRLPTGITWEDDPRVLAERGGADPPEQSVQFQVNSSQEKIAMSDDFLPGGKSLPRDSSKKESRPGLVRRVSSPLFLKRLKPSRQFGGSIVKSISRGTSYIGKRRRRWEGGGGKRIWQRRNAISGGVSETTNDNYDVSGTDAEAEEYLADDESDLDGGNSAAASFATEEKPSGNQLLLQSLTMDGADPRRLEELVHQPSFQNMVYEQWKAQEKRENKGKKLPLLKQDWNLMNGPLSFSFTTRSAASDAIDPGQQVNNRPAKSFLRRAITGDFGRVRSGSATINATTGVPSHLTRSLYEEPTGDGRVNTMDQSLEGVRPSDVSATYSSSVTGASQEDGPNITFEDLPTPKSRSQRPISPAQMGGRLPSIGGPTEYQGTDNSLYGANIDEEDGYLDLLPTFTTTLTGNYLSYQPTIGRNSTFVGLSQRQKNELGGVEYRAIKLLCNILLTYYFGITIIAFLFLVPWIIERKYYADIVRGDGISPTWWGFFTSWGAFGNVGLSLAPDSMSSFSAAPYPIILMSVLIIIGNTGFPIMLRFIIWIMFKFSRDLSQIRESLGFLLDHPRRCFTMLFPGAATWYLLLSLIVLNVADLVLFIILDLNSSELDPLAKGYRVMDCLFQSISTRTAGYSVFNLVDLHVAMQVTYMLMMYISTLPTAISIRRTNVYEEQSLGLYGKMESVDSYNEDDSSEDDTEEYEESEESESSKAENSTSSSPQYDMEEAAGQSSKAGAGDGNGSRHGNHKTMKKKRNRKRVKKKDPEASTKSYIGAHLRRQLSYDLWFLFLSLFIICLCENGKIKDLEKPYFNVFSILFEIVSAYGTVGLSLGYPNTDTSFSAQFTTLSKLVIICLLVRGKNRGLPYSLDRAIMLPSERLDHIDQVTDLKLKRHVSDIDDHDALNQYFKHKATRFVDRFRRVKRDIRAEAEGGHNEAPKEKVHLLDQGRSDEEV